MYHLVIESGTPANPAKKKPGKPQKTRSFGADLLNYVTADQLWEGGQAKTETIRPVLMIMAGSDNGMRAFVQNLRMGRKAEWVSGERSSYSRDTPPRFELLKTAGYHYTVQRLTEPLRIGTQKGLSVTSIVTAYMPDLFSLEPGMVNPAGIMFVMVTPLWWIRREVRLLMESGPEIGRVIAHLRACGVQDSDAQIRDVIPQAVYLGAYLDKRTIYPLVDDLRFMAQLWYKAQEYGVIEATPSSTAPDSRWNRDGKIVDVYQNPAIEAFMANPVACVTGHERLKGFLLDQIALFKAKVPEFGQDLPVAPRVPITLPVPVPVPAAAETPVRKGAYTQAALFDFFEKAS